MKTKSIDENQDGPTQKEHEAIVLFLVKELPNYIKTHGLKTKKKESLEKILETICKDRPYSFQLSQDQIAKLLEPVIDKTDNHSYISRMISQILNPILNDFSLNHEIHPSIRLFFYWHDSRKLRHFGFHFACSEPKQIVQSTDRRILCSTKIVPLKEARESKVGNGSIEKNDNTLLARETAPKTDGFATEFINNIGKADVFESIDKLFVAPHSYGKILNNITEYKPVLLLGNSGDGKSYTAAYLMNEALRNRRKIKYVKGPSQFIGYFTDLNNIVACQTLLPENGFLFLDDPWGCNEEPTASGEVVHKILTLCDIAPSRSCSLVITSQKHYIPEDQDYFDRLCFAGMNVFDFDDSSVGLSPEQRKQIYLRLIELRSAGKDKPLILDSLALEGAELVTQLNMNMFEIEMWAHKSLSVTARQDLNNSASRMLSQLVYSLISSDRFSEEYKTAVALLSFMNGAVVSDVESEWESIVSGMDGITIQPFESPLWARLFIVKQDCGEERIEFKHSIVAKEIDQLSCKTFGSEKIVKILKRIMNNRQASIKRSGVKTLFRLSDCLKESIWSCIDYIINTRDDVMLYELIYQLGMLIEKHPSNEATEKMRQLFYIASPPIIHIWIKTVIRSWEQMPDELKKEINSLLTPPIGKYRYEKGKEHAFEEIIIQMSKRVNVFIDQLFDLVTNHRQDICPYALDIIRGFCFRMDVSTEEVITIAEPIMGVTSWSDRERLKEELLCISDKEMRRRCKLIQLVSKFQYSYA